MANSQTLLEEEGEGAPSTRPVWALLPYLWPKDRPDLRKRVVVSIVSLVLGKVIAVYTPPLFGYAVDESKDPATMVLWTALGFVAVFALASVMSTLFSEVRNAIFAKVSFHAMRQIAVQTFQHIHALSLRFHLERRTGGLGRVIDRGTKGIDTLLSFGIFLIFPTLLEFLLVCTYFLIFFNIWFVVVLLVTIVAYTHFTFAITRWRISYRRTMNDSDTEASSKAVDSLLNYETVKYFSAEGHETRRFDNAMKTYTDASVKSQTSLTVLNVGQAAILMLGIGGVLALCIFGIKNGTLNVGSMTVAFLYLVQLQRPLNFLGTIYREIMQALADMEQMFKLLHQPQEVQDKPDAKPLIVDGGEIRFDNVVFSYEPERVVLKGVSFRVPPGKTVAVVGPSGAGKSTISRLLYRFYDIQGGHITIDGQDLRDVTQSSLRASIGIVPQDTVLFNDTIRYNISYGRVDATEAEILEAARLAQIDPFIRELPKGYDSMVGERGLKLSGGEKQRVAIARTVLKNPPVLLLDEATSALDTHTEREIQSALKTVSRNRTTLVIAHRLSTVVDADEILVLVKGEIAERGRHADLVAKAGVYAAMWNRQKQAAEEREKLEALEADVKEVADDVVEAVHRLETIAGGS
jgi:ATP-binding cassette subfamily B protein